MQIDDDKQVNPIRGRTIIDVLYGLFSGLFYLLLIPFQWAKRGIDIIKADNMKISSFRKWHKKERLASRRQKKFNDEF